jgi:hypothetical protein
MTLEEEITDRYPAATLPPPAKKAEQEKYFKLPEGEPEIAASIDIQQGYDNNVDLDSKRHKDGFLQCIANAEIAFPKGGQIKGKAGVDFFGTVYYKYNSNNIFDTMPYVGFDWEIIPGLIWKNQAAIDYFSYPNEKESTFGGIELSSYLRHFLTEDLYHELGYEYIRRWYPDRKASLSDATKGNTEREDKRDKVKYTIGMYFENFLVKVSNELYHNDSNDMYQDYYDYWVYRLRPSVLYFFTDNIYANASFLYKYTPFDDRRSTENIDRKVRDHIYVISTSLYYDITKNLTLGLTYSYTENLSNDPFQEYSGSVMSGGFFYSF